MQNTNTIQNTKILYLTKDLYAVEIQPNVFGIFKWNYFDGNLYEIEKKDFEEHPGKLLMDAEYSEYTTFFDGNTFCYKNGESYKGEWIEPDLAELLEIAKSIIGEELFGKFAGFSLDFENQPDIKGNPLQKTDDYIEEENGEYIKEEDTFVLRSFDRLMPDGRYVKRYHLVKCNCNEKLEPEMVKLSDLLQGKHNKSAYIAYMDALSYGDKEYLLSMYGVEFLMSGNNAIQRIFINCTASCLAQDDTLTYVQKHVLKDSLS